MSRHVTRRASTVAGGASVRRRGGAAGGFSEGLASVLGGVYPFNLTGQPAATLPAGFSAEGLPVGLQIVGRRLEDSLVLRASAAFEATEPWAAVRPNV